MIAVMNNEEITIRPSIDSDAEQLMRLDHIVWDDSTAPAPIRWSSPEDYAAHCPPGSQLVAVQGGTVCGYIGLRTPTKLPSNSHVYELNIAIDPSFQRKGIGRQLLVSARKTAVEHRKTKLSLRVLATNESAIAFYREFGFTEQGRLVQEFYLNGRYVDDVLMYMLLEQ
jgi:ribosomal protein S18 acetylase RimI-like enzyme